MSRLFEHVQREIIYAHRFIFYFPTCLHSGRHPGGGKVWQKTEWKSFFPLFLLFISHSDSCTIIAAAKRASEEPTKNVFFSPLFIFAASFSVSVGSYATIELIVGGFFLTISQIHTRNNECVRFFLSEKKIYPKIFIFHRSCLSPEHE